MGQRCNLITVEGGFTTVYYDHWVASELDAMLFWGPEDALAFIRQRDPTEHPLLDQVWGEGGAVVNLDAKRLTWFGGEDIKYDIILKRLHEQLMARNWAGWQIDWCVEGVGTLADVAGLSREGLMMSTPDEPFLYEDGEFRDDSSTLLTMRRGGVFTSTRLHGDVDALALQNANDTAALIDDDPVPLAQQDLEAGVHIDLDSKRVGFWTAHCADSLDAIFANWPGWHLTFWGDRFEEHRALVPDLEWPTPTKAKLCWVIDSLRGSLDRKGGNPALNSIRALQQQGRDVQLNPATFETRESTQNNSAKRAILDAFENDLEACGL